jgi:NADPH:quinone reductase-like Zn-dependent oxidoreductase
MRAVVVENGSVVVRKRPDPVPQTGELLVAVRAAGLNGADLLQRAGFYPAPPGSPEDIPGLELSGTVVATGPGTSRFTTGDQVMAVVGGGAQAELAIVHELAAIRVPEALPLLQAGGFPEAFTVAHDALFTQCNLATGERLLVNGAAGGVGIAAVQLGVLAGAEVVASVRARKFHGALEAFGAMAVDPADAPSKGPYDVVLELVGAPNLGSDIDSLAERGRICVIGVGAGTIGPIDLRALMTRAGCVRGSTLRARSLQDKAAAARLVERDVLPLVEAHKIRVPLEGVFPIQDVHQAYERFVAGSKLGKIVLEVPA